MNHGDFMEQLRQSETEKFHALVVETYCSRNRIIELDNAANAVAHEIALEGRHYYYLREQLRLQRELLNAFTPKTED